MAIHYPCRLWIQFLSVFQFFYLHFICMYILCDERKMPSNQTNGLIIKILHFLSIALWIERESEKKKDNGNIFIEYSILIVWSLMRMVSCVDWKSGKLTFHRIWDCSMVRACLCGVWCMCGICRVFIVSNLNFNLNSNSFDLRLEVGGKYCRLLFVYL